MVDTSRRLQSVYVPAGDGVRLAVDVWLPVERTAVGGAGHDASCFTRYGQAEETFTLRLGSDSHLDLPVRYD
jgi:uncharacterized protein